MTKSAKSTKSSKPRKSKTPSVMDGLLTTQQAAAMLGVTQRRVRAIIERGHLRAVNVGHQYLIRRDDFDGYKTDSQPRRDEYAARVMVKKGKARGGGRSSRRRRSTAAA